MEWELQSPVKRNNIVANNQFKYSTIYSTTDYPLVNTFYVPAGKKVRVAIAWNSKSKDRMVKMHSK